MTARDRYIEALKDACRVATELMAEGRRDRAVGLATAVDVGTSAAFLFNVSERAYEDATNVVRLAIAHAQREEDS